jgi:hypothetical protein
MQRVSRLLLQVRAPTMDSMLIDSPTERTTAGTDLILALLALGCCLFVLRVGRGAPGEARVWGGAFALLSLAAFLGAIAHGLKMPPRANALLWRPLNLALGLTISLFVVGVVYDLRNKAAARRILAPMLAVGVGFFVLTQVASGTFLMFVLFQAVAMLFALGAYGWLGVKRRLAGAWWMAGGVLATLIAAAIQATGAVSFTLVWPFDHNGVYHLVQMVGLLLLTAGLRAAFLANRSRPAD